MLTCFVVSAVHGCFDLLVVCSAVVILLAVNLAAINVFCTVPFIVYGIVSCPSKPANMETDANSCQGGLSSDKKNVFLEFPLMLAC